MDTSAHQTQLDVNGRTDEGTHLVNSIQGPTSNGGSYRDLPIKSNAPRVNGGHSFIHHKNLFNYDQIKFN